MSVGKAIVIIWTFLYFGFAAWAEDSNPKLTGQDPNTQLSKATLWIGSGSDTKGESPSLNLVVFTRDHQTQLASLQRGQLCRENCQMQAGESQAISVTVDTPSATYQQCQGFEKPPTPTTRPVILPDLSMRTSSISPILFSFGS